PNRATQNARAATAWRWRTAGGQYGSWSGFFGSSSHCLRPCWLWLTFGSRERLSDLLRARALGWFRLLRRRFLRGLGLDRGSAARGRLRGFLDQLFLAGGSLLFTSYFFRRHGPWPPRPFEKRRRLYRAVAVAKGCSTQPVGPGRSIVGAGFH